MGRSLKNIEKTAASVTTQRLADAVGVPPMKLIRLSWDKSKFVNPVPASRDTHNRVGKPPLMWSLADVISVLLVEELRKRKLATNPRVRAALAYGFDAATIKELWKSKREWFILIQARKRSAGLYEYSVVADMVTADQCMNLAANHAGAVYVISASRIVHMAKLLLLDC